ncbi:hypothetical protein GCM10010168_89870 [Actinoplanes ianthinogenes]|uniref:DNA alkylation repair protein n=1 Tax=Actinoplanes ianthinogenes TaxID=122358 RepID=A0ABM7M1R4_9ACTN|nr:DNA alkylation repair protein [Actinoplanes ianthinogenes]BCJ45569.1 hypothetical protein Aiant_62260 [Actinoplanes ianthinogenes]GGR57000.1 hypothetical protein GCM10010168_89870 [Actinoplanes ianthinogenes]
MTDSLPQTPLSATPLAETLLARLTTAFEAHRDDARALAMAAYLRDRFPFFGLSAPTRRAAARTALTGLPDPSETDLAEIARACWSRDEREFHQFACDYLIAHPAVPTPAFLEVTADLITTKSWWDTVDPLATRFVGGLVRRHPTLLGRMDDWSESTNLWLIRTALLHQLHYGPSTDEKRLFRYCSAQAAHPDFFVRKAIGWALRHYARTNPQAVRAYLTTESAHLSPLSIREAAKHL